MAAGGIPISPACLQFLDPRDDMTKLLYAYGAVWVFGLNLYVVLSDNNHTLARITDAIEKYQEILDTSSKKDQLLAESLVQDYKSDLMSLKRTQQMNQEESSSIMCVVLCRTAHGLFNSKMALTKELLSKDILVNVFERDIFVHSPWIVNLFKVALESISDHSTVQSCKCNSSSGESVSFVELLFHLQLWKTVNSTGMRPLILPEPCGSGKAIFDSQTWSQVFISVLSHQDLTALSDLLSYVTKCYKSGELTGLLLRLCHTVSYVQCQSGLSCYMWEELLAENVFNSTSSSHFTKGGIFGLIPEGVLSQSRCDVAANNDRTCMNLAPISVEDLIQNRFVDVHSLSAESGWRKRSKFEDVVNPSLSTRCSLPRIHLSDMTKDVFSVFVRFSIPVIIEGISSIWYHLFHLLKRSALLEKFGNIDFLGGRIPYGALFGDVHGYSTMEEFVRYMDTYERDFDISQLGEEFPMYIFDPVFLEDFREDYTLPDELFVWSKGKVVRQFILGPAGSGAPFHHHCPAFNTVFYGRKKWYLLPPAKAFYSKRHPLTWFNDTSITEEYIQCTQGPGDTLFVPQGWGHATLNMRETVAVAMEIDNGLC